MTVIASIANEHKVPTVCGEVAHVEAGGLASLSINYEELGRLTPGKLTGFKSRLVSAVAGSVVYFLIRAIVLQMGMDANDMKLLSAVIVALALCVPVVWEKFKLRASYSKGGEADA